MSEPDIFDLMIAECVACEGTGVSSMGFPCDPCEGTGQRKPETDSDA